VEISDARPLKIAVALVNALADDVDRRAYEFQHRN
jgi:hypothetical protein